jgi:hypothetical protein
MLKLLTSGTQPQREEHTQRSKDDRRADFPEMTERNGSQLEILYLTKISSDMKV